MGVWKTEKRNEIDDEFRSERNIPTEEKWFLLVFLSLEWLKERRWKYRVGKKKRNWWSFKEGNVSGVFAGD